MVTAQPTDGIAGVTGVRTTTSVVKQSGSFYGCVFVGLTIPPSYWGQVGLTWVKESMPRFFCLMFKDTIPIQPFSYFAQARPIANSQHRMSLLYVGADLWRCEVGEHVLATYRLAGVDISSIKASRAILYGEAIDRVHRMKPMWFSPAIEYCKDGIWLPAEHANAGRLSGTGWEIAGRLQDNGLDSNEAVIGSSAGVQEGGLW